jgi:Spy/CpxP family protein refolding chaperone
MNPERTVKKEATNVKTLTRAMLLLLALAASALLLAQMPPSPPDPAMFVQHRVQFLTTVLNLTAAQQQQATTFFTNAAAGESALHAQFKTARQSLSTAVKNNDVAGIDQAANSLGSLSAQRASIQAKANAAFYQILTSDQQAKLSQLEKQGPGGPAMMVTGGPGGFFLMEH